LLGKLPGLLEGFASVFVLGLGKPGQLASHVSLLFGLGSSGTQVSGACFGLAILLFRVVALHSFAPASW
jgi:hypothetical protein